MPAPVPAVSTLAIPGLPGASVGGTPNAGAAFEAMLAALFGAPTGAQGAAPAAGSANASALAHANPAAAGLFGKTALETEGASDDAPTIDGDPTLPGADIQGLALAAAFIPPAATVADGGQATGDAPEANGAATTAAPLLVQADETTIETAAPAEPATTPETAKAPAPPTTPDEPPKAKPEPPKAEAAPTPPQHDGDAATTSIVAREAAKAEPPAPGPRDTRAERSDNGRRAHGDPASAVLPESAKPPVAAHPSPGASNAQPNGLPFQLAARAAETKADDTASAEPAAQTAHAETPPPLVSASDTASEATLRAAAPLTHPVRGGPETIASLAAHFLKKLDGRSTRFDVELDPAGLGRVDVRVEVNAHGRMTASMAFDNPQAAAELRGRAAELARALEQAGFDVSGGLSFDVAGDQGQGGRNGAFQDEARTPAWQGRAFQAALNGAASADDAAGGPLTVRRRFAAGVDIKI